MTTRRQLGLPQPRVVRKSLHTRATPSQTRPASAILTATADVEQGTLWGQWARNHSRRPALRLLSRSIRTAGNEIAD